MLQHTASQFKKLRALRTLAENQAVQGSVPQLRRYESNKQPKKIGVGSMGCLASADFIEFAPRGELKESIALVVRDVNR
jgi:hypothetical protein